MTRDEAIEKCAKALARRHNYPEQTWKDNPTQTGLVENIITCLEALGVWKSSGDVVPFPEG
jgi:hypothetical protein